jgi:5-methylcytosine-specific restriction endonuclease McrA
MLEKSAYVETVNPLKVFERDGWVCQGCDTPTSPSLRGRKCAGAPELEHIIPLSMGGEHSYRNTQLLCFHCNNRKGARYDKGPDYSEPLKRIA